MIHRLSRLGGALCGSLHVPHSFKHDRFSDVFQTTEPGVNDSCAECESLHASHVAAARGKPVPSIGNAELQCPRCNRYHVDREEWYHKPHHTHLCEHCSHEWYVPQGVRGIEPVSVRGRLIALRHVLADWLYQRLS